MNVAGCAQKSETFSEAVIASGFAELAGTTLYMDPLGLADRFSDQITGASLYSAFRWRRYLPA
jgi:hypothetical protein